MKKNRITETGEKEEIKETSKEVTLDGTKLKLEDFKTKVSEVEKEKDKKIVQKGNSNYITLEKVIA